MHDGEELGQVLRVDISPVWREGREGRQASECDHSRQDRSTVCAVRPWQCVRGRCKWMNTCLHSQRDGHISTSTVQSTTQQDTRKRHCTESVRAVFCSHVREVSGRFKAVLSMRRATSGLASDGIDLLNLKPLLISAHTPSHGQGSYGQLFSPKVAGLIGCTRNGLCAPPSPLCWKCFR